MDTSVESALAQGGIVDITTVGAKSGMDRRIEIVFHQFDGRYYITGKPGFKRDWLANMTANPEFTLHLKRGVTADVAATATEITGEEERARLLYRILTESWDNEPDKAAHILPRWVADAPLVEFTIA
jgi:deazaflavin-dependent oxidoreductase (nitroreductase family)